MSPLTRKLARGSPLDAADRARLDEIRSTQRSFEAGVDLIAADERPDRIRLILDGLACRYKVFSNGRRSIVAYMLPGDFCDLHVEILGRMDHSIGTLTQCTVAEIDPHEIEAIARDHPRIIRALWWATLVDEAILREWIAGIARRPAPQRTAHLFCELRVRMQSVGLAAQEQFEFPFTHEVLADSLGISTVHVNRVLQQLRQRGLLQIQDRRVRIADPERLQAFAEFDPAYLHIEPRHGHGADV